MSTLASVFGYGLLSARAAASVAGRFYYATDTTFMYRDNGSTWDTLTVGAGSMATDALWDAAGDLAVGTGANTAHKLVAGTSGTFLKSAGAADPTWSFPPGYELDYVEKTTNTSITATTEGTANTIITSSSITFDGAPVNMEFYTDGLTPAAVSTADITVVLRDDTAGTVLGVIAYHESQAATASYVPVLVRRRFTPAAGARVYSIRASVSTGTGTVLGGAGGTGGTNMPAYLRFTKV